VYYQVVSFNYKKCSLEERESIAFKDENEIKEFLKMLTDFDFIVEAFVVNTCNRVEIVSASRDNFATYHAILGLLSRVKGLNFHSLAKSAKRYEDDEAIEHIFSVVSSLDSMVVGEAQITGQVKDAYRLSFKNKTAGVELNKVLNHALKCAACVRNSTQISSKPISIASVAVAQAEEELKSLSGMVGVVIGSGEMGKLAAKHLLRAGADVLLLSRTKEHAQKLANELGENVKVGDYEKLQSYINKYRLLFSATSSKEPIITKDMIEEKKIDRLWFDMAIPRDIDNSIDNSSIKIYYIDDLQEISKNNHALRKEQALKAADIVKEYKDNFLKWLQALAVEPVIKQMRLNINQIAKQEAQRVVKKGFIPKEYQENLEYMAKQLFDKFLHAPTKKMREISKESDGMETIEAIKKVFDINTDSVDPKKYK
jgi:glutamyl-tRNA reductase